MAEFHREIVEEPGFWEQLQQIQPDPRLADEILDHVKRGLAQSPEVVGIFDPEFDMWLTSVMLYTRSSELEIALLYYTFDDERVYLIAIKRG